MGAAPLYREVSIDFGKRQANEHLEFLMEIDGQTKPEIHRENIGRFKLAPK